MTVVCCAVLCCAVLRCAGPVDGPAIFESCSNCQVAVACHLFKANACTGCEFGEWRWVCCGMACPQQRESLGLGRPLHPGLPCMLGR